MNNKASKNDEDRDKAYRFEGDVNDTLKEYDLVSKGVKKQRKEIEEDFIFPATNEWKFEHLRLINVDLCKAPVLFIENVNNYKLENETNEDIQFLVSSKELDNVLTLCTKSKADIIKGTHILFNIKPTVSQSIKNLIKGFTAACSRLYDSSEGNVDFYIKDLYYILGFDNITESMTLLNNVSTSMYLLNQDVKVISDLSVIYPSDLFARNNVQLITTENKATSRIVTTNDICAQGLGQVIAAIQTNYKELKNKIKDKELKELMFKDSIFPFVTVHGYDFSFYYILVSEAYFSAIKTTVPTSPLKLNIIHERLSFRDRVDRQIIIKNLLLFKDVCTNHISKLDSLLSTKDSTYK